MLNYEVNLKISSEIYSEYLEWLIPHIKEMLSFEGFLKADLYEDLEQALNDEYVSITASYQVDSQENLQNYLSTKANHMREDGIKRFGGKFQANRRILKLKHSYTTAN